jgi:hypothetical protein
MALVQKLADNGGGTIHIVVGEYEIKSQIVLLYVLRLNFHFIDQIFK